MRNLKLVFLVITILSVFTACGSQEEPDASNRVSSEEVSEEYVYVPEYLEREIHIPDSINRTETTVQGDRLYQYNYIYDLEARTATDQFCIFSKEGELLLELSLGGNGSEGQYSHEFLRKYDVDADGNVYTIEYGYGERSQDADYYLCCYDKAGTRVFSHNITDTLKVDESGVDISQMLLDQNGRIYIMCQSSVKLFEADGSPAGSIMAAVSFNKRNDKYKVVIRSYVDSSAGESYEDGLTKLSLQVAAGEGPDIFDLTQLDMEALTLSGAVEDLGPWLEGSSVLDREDYLENVLEGYTYGGKLAAIPYSFSLQTMAGKASELGEGMGWTLEEVFAYAAGHPQAKLFQGATKSRILEFCMMCDMERFLDWDSGMVNFDSELFVELLKFANSYPDTYTAQENSPDPPELLQSGEVLIYPQTLYYFNEIQLCHAIFDQPVTYVGYPTADGSANAILNCGTLYGISAASQNKEGAWAFIESWLSRSVEFAWGFSPRRSQLELQIANAKEVKKDSSGKILTDEDGNPLPAHGTAGIRFSFDGKEYTYHACTDEEIGWVEELLAVARPVKNSDSRVMAIIEEEVQAFYAGQRTAEDVAHTIQSRVQVYVDENR